MPHHPYPNPFDKPSPGTTPPPGWLDPGGPQPDYYPRRTTQMGFWKTAFAVATGIIIAVVASYAVGGLVVYATLRAMLP